MSYGGITGQTPDLNEYLPKSGGTMTGPLVLSGNPSGNLEAASKQYVDSKASDWKVIESITHSFSEKNNGTYIGEFNFNSSKLSACNNLKIEVKWKLSVVIGGNEYQSSTITIGRGPIREGNTNFFTLNYTKPRLSLSISEQVVLSNYYQETSDSDLQVRKKAFYTNQPINTTNPYTLDVYYSGNPTAFKTSFTIDGNGLVLGNNSTCTITIYGKN